MMRDLAIAWSILRSEPHSVLGILAVAGLIVVVALIAALAQGALEGSPA